MGNSACMAPSASVRCGRESLTPPAEHRGTSRVGWPMSADPIPTDRADAFNKAIAACHNWTVEENRDSLIEPEIVQRHSISAVCNFVEAFNDPMPDNVYQFLCWLAAERSGAAPDNHSYASGARCLRSLLKSERGARRDDPACEVRCPNRSETPRLRSQPNATA